MSNIDYVTNQDIMLLLAKRIEDYRLAARMSQKEMAEKSGVNLATISHFEQGVNQNKFHIIVSDSRHVTTCQ